MDARNNFIFSVPIRKCHLTHQDSSCPPSLELYPWRTGRFPDMSLHESLKLSETVKFCTPGGQNVNSNKSVTNYYYGVTLQNLSIDIIIMLPAWQHPPPLPSGDHDVQNMTR